MPPKLTAPLALTMGDPAGIGPDITLACWRDHRALGLPPFCVFGSAEVLRKRAMSLAWPMPIREIDRVEDAGAVFEVALPVMPVALAVNVNCGKPDPANGASIIAAITRATTAVLASEAHAIVTNPIAKSVLYQAGFTHPGHTEFLAALAARHHGGPVPHPVMMLASPELRVVPLTVHVPLAAVPGLLTQELIDTTVRILAASLTADFGVARPRIAVAGLNPHAGESGSIGREDVEVIAPAVRALVADGLHVAGPLSADTLFHPAARAAYDAVVAMYHDQALIPVKTLAFDSAVNVTLGLPFVRTSPDHGTAFDIAGTGRASPASLAAAIRMAAAMADRRRGARP